MTQFLNGHPAIGQALRSTSLDVWACIFLTATNVFFFARTFWLKNWGSDYIAQFLPHYQFMISNLQKGVIPFWFPYAFDGLPELFQPSLSFFHPSTILGITVGVLFNQGQDIAFTGSIFEFIGYCNLLVGQIGFYFLLRRALGIQRSASILGALAFGLNPTTWIMAMGTINILGVSLLPWLVLALLRCLHNPTSKAYAFLVLANLLLFLVGYPYYYVLFGFCQMGLAAFFGLRKLAVVLLALGNAILLSCFTLLPYYHVISQSSRNTPSDPTSEFHFFASIIPTRIINVLNPFTYGSNYSNQDPLSYITGCILSWGVLGFILLVIGLSSLKKNPLHYWLTAVLVIGGLYSLGGYLNAPGFLMLVFPFFDNFRSHHHGIVLAMFSGSALVAVGAQRLLSATFPASAEKFLWLFALLLLFGLSFSPLYHPEFLLKPNVVFISLSRTAILLVVGLLLFRLLANFKTRFFFALCLAVMLLEYSFYLVNSNSLLVDYGYAQFHSMNSLVPEQARSDDSLFRVYFANDQFSYNTGNLGLFNYVGYETVPSRAWYESSDRLRQNHLAFSNVKYVTTTDPDYSEKNPNASLLYVTGPGYNPKETFISEVEGLPFWSEKSTKSHYVYQLQNSLPRFFIPENIGNCQPLTPSCIKDDNPPELVLVENAPLLSFQNPVPSDVTISVLKYTPNTVRLQVKSPSQALISSSEVWDQGWSVSINDHKETMYKASGGFRAFVVPPGESTVEMTYFPPLLLPGLLVSLAGIALLLIVGRLPLLAYLVTSHQNDTGGQIGRAISSTETDLGGWRLCRPVGRMGQRAWRLAPGDRQTLG